jgi:hypothetical protein
MTKKDYVVVAEALGTYLASFILSGDDITECKKKYQSHKSRLEQIFYPRLKEDNPGFDPDIFSKYIDKIVDGIVAH